MDRITVAGILIPIVLLAAAFSVRTAHATSPRERAVQALDSLIDRYWNPALSMFNTADPCNDCNRVFHYWWQAHAIDALLDGYVLTGDPKYMDVMEQLYAGVRRRNGGHLFNDYYDDMLWMALALLRAYEITGQDRYLTNAQRLWLDIQGGWNDHYGGGIAWRKTQRDYKNAPANGPAVILTARLYRVTGDPEYLDWALRIYNWLEENLVDPRTHLVWDGINRQGDGAIDKDWLFTYNQGTYIGANVALWEVTGDEQYLERAKRTATASLLYLTRSGGVFQDEGQGDGGLFKGILVRYLVELVRADEDTAQIRNALLRNAESAWASRTPSGTFGPRWQGPPHSGTVDLSSHLSGVMLMTLTAGLQASEVSAAAP